MFKRCSLEISKQQVYITKHHEIRAHPHLLVISIVFNVLYSLQMRMQLRKASKYNIIINSSTTTTINMHVHYTYDTVMSV